MTAYITNVQCLLEQDKPRLKTRRAAHFTCFFVAVYVQNPYLSKIYIYIDKQKQTKKPHQPKEMPLAKWSCSSPCFFGDITDSSSAPSHPSHPSLQQALHEAHGEEVPGHVQHQSPVSEARPVAQDLRRDARPAFSQGNAEELTDAGDATEEAFLEVVTSGWGRKIGILVHQNCVNPNVSS